MIPKIITDNSSVINKIPVSMTMLQEKRNDLRKKEHRPAEFLIEHSIRIISFLSIAFIMLIFIFVFREAASIFSPHQETHSATATAETNTVETYGEPETTTPGQSSVETYGGDDIVDLPSMESAATPNHEAIPKSSIKNLFDKVWQPTSMIPKYGIWPLLVGSLNVALLSLLIAAPLAILAALYTSTFASNRMKEIVKPIIEILAGFPSVVIGFIALIVLASILQSLLGLQYRLNAFTGGLAMAIAIIPVIFTISEDAINSVPRSYVDASLALGAEKWETAVFVVLPAAIPGIFAAILLGIGRAIGETMIVLMATGNAAFASFNPFEPVRTMSATIGAEMAEVVFGDFHYSVLFFIGIILFAISFLINLTAETVVRKLVMRQFK
jgi:phosphate transport system permease protein